jgi:phospholipid transport system substrate-binding protein
MKRLALLLFPLLLAAGAARAEAMPDQIAREASDKIIQLIKANRDAYKKDYRKLYAMVDENVLPHFDFRAMSRAVLGRRWREASEEQRERFTHEFRELLVRTYATALLKYNDEKIVYLPFRVLPEDRTAIVKSEVRKTDGSPPIAIHYSFYKTVKGWKVYDVAIEGPSLVATYQRTFGERLQKESLDALIVSLAKENSQAAAKSGGAKGGSAKK